MSLSSRLKSVSFRLQKLKISSFTDQARQVSVGAPFEVMFNPASISVKHGNKFSPLRGINTKAGKWDYIYTHSDEIQLDLIIDGTGVTDLGATRLFKLTVAEKITQFMENCFHMAPDSHEPRYLKIQWGTGVLQDFECRLRAVDIEYSLFDRNGASLHAVLKAKFVQDVSNGKRALLEGKNSPDLTHTRIVKSGDTLPLLSKEIYGSSQYYLRLAQINNINDFRNLIPGQKIIFPPLDNNGVVE